MVEIASFGAGLATAHEVHRLMRAAQAAGKRVIALLRGDDAGLREYLVAAGAGDRRESRHDAHTARGRDWWRLSEERARQIEDPGADAAVEGVQGRRRDTGRDTMSPALRESMEAVVADWEKILVETIASARKLSPEKRAS